MKLFAIASIIDVFLTAHALVGGNAPTKIMSSSTKVLVSNRSNNNSEKEINEKNNNFGRRSALSNVFASVGIVPLLTILGSNVDLADAKPDCMTDCLKNCKLIAPKEPGYCLDNCNTYCAQEDRTDGLSGSVSSAGGETGILGQGTVVKGEDKPPSISLPGLDFKSDKGKKLIGY